MINKCKVYTFGPSKNTKGGISSVIMLYKKALASKTDFHWIYTYGGKGRIFDVFLFAQSVIRVIFICLFGNKSNTIFHIHSSTYGSFFRKKIILRICSAFGYKTVFQMHGADFDTYIKEKKAKNVFKELSRASCVIVLSEGWYREIKNLIPELSNLKILYNPC